MSAEHAGCYMRAHYTRRGARYWKCVACGLVQVFERSAA